MLIAARNPRGLLIRGSPVLLFTTPPVLDFELGLERSFIPWA